MTAIAGHAASKFAAPLDSGARQTLASKVGVRGDVASFGAEGATLFHAHTGNGPRTCAFDLGEYPVVVAGDIRLDNRDDISRALGNAGCGVRSDADLIRRAFLRWGVACFEKLIGDFAFAVWDKRDRSLYCCRDHFGVRPLFYQNLGGTFAFASEAKMLPIFQDHTFSEIYMASFIASIPYSDVKTAHPGVQRLLPGHWLRWQEGELAVTKYWELQVKDIVSPDPAEEFRELFTRAVRDRTSEPSGLASLLSGGLDSSAITAVAEGIAQGRNDGAGLRTYSIVYDDNPLIDERGYIKDVLARGRYQPRLLSMDHYQPLKGMSRSLRTQEGPFNSPGLQKSTLMFKAAASDGVQVVLNGHGGDEVVGYGTGRLWEMALKDQWLGLIPLVRTHSRLSNSSATQLYLQLLERYGSKGFHTRAARWILRHLVATFVHSTQQRITAWESYISPSYADAMNLKERSQADLMLTSSEKTSDQHYQLKGLKSPLVGSAFETFDKTSAACGLEVRYPFFDIRLAQFCIGLDSSEKLRKNETRSIMRRAMGNLYPNSIAKRQDKTNFMPELAVGLVRYHDDVLRAMAQDSSGYLAQYFDMDKIRTGLRRLRQDPLKTDGGDVLFFWRVAILYLWMERIEI